MHDAGSSRRSFHSVEQVPQQIDLVQMLHVMLAGFATKSKHREFSLLSFRSLHEQRSLSCRIGSTGDVKFVQQVVGCFGRACIRRGLCVVLQHKLFFAVGGQVRESQKLRHVFTRYNSCRCFGIQPGVNGIRSNNRVDSFEVLGRLQDLPNRPVARAE